MVLSTLLHLTHGIVGTPIEITRRRLNSARIACGIPADLIRYLSVGVANTVIGLSTIYLMMYFAHASDVVANLLGYCAGIICSFVLNRRWTFSSTDAVLPQLVKFLLVLGLAYLANLETVIALVRLLGENRYVAQAIGTLPYTAVGYLGNRFFTFRRLSSS